MMIKIYVNVIMLIIRIDFDAGTYFLFLFIITRVRESRVVFDLFVKLRGVPFASFVVST